MLIYLPVKPVKILTISRLVIAAAVLLPGVASAQIGSGLNCAASIAAPLLRAESFSDQIGDIVITCTGGNAAQYTPGQPLPVATFTVNLGTPVTSRLLNTSVSPNISEALLLVDDPGSAEPAPVAGTGPQAPQTLCATPLIGAAVGGCTQYAVAAPIVTVMSSSPYSITSPANVYQGLWNASAPNQVTFPAVPILPPVYSGVTRTFRITNIRANIASLVAPGFTGSQPLSASVTVNNSTVISLSSPTLTAGIIEPSLSTATRNIINTGALAPPVFSPCAGANGSSPIAVALLQFTENFSSAFKTRTNSGQQPSLSQNIPGQVYSTESGFTIQLANTTVTGQADYGTRLQATIHGIPSGVRTFVSINNVVNSNALAPSNFPQAALVTGATAPDSPTVASVAYPAVAASTTVAGIPAAEIFPDSTGAATAVWESITNNPAALDQYEFVVYTLFTTAVANANVSVNMTYAPIPAPGSSTAALAAWGTASSTLTEPRFVDTSTGTGLYTTSGGSCTLPQLTVSKTHGGGFPVGSTGDTYTIVVGNASSAPTYTSGTVTVVDNMPLGLSATGIGGVGWSCTLITLTCTRGDSLAPGGTYQPITVTVSVTTNAVATVTNVVTVSGGGSNSASASDVTSIGSGPPAVTSFSPSNGAVGVNTNATLSWGPSSGATSYYLYLGTSSPPNYYTTVTSPSFSVPLAQDTTYYWSVTAVNGGGSTVSAIQSFTTYTSGSLFVPVTPCRVSDTRLTTGTFGGPYMTGGSTRTIPIPSGNCGIPSSATAYSLNVTVIPHSTLQYLTIWPAGQAQPYVSTLNSSTGAVVANAAIVPAGSGGVSLFVTDDSDVVLDVNGYFTSSATAGALSLYVVTPCRVVDTRSASSIFGGYLTAGSVRTFALPSGGCGIPGSAQAYSLNITAVPHQALQYLTVWPAGQTQPYVSTLNSTGGVVANAAIVPSGGPNVGPGAIDVYTTGDTDLVIDITGYFNAPGGTGALAFYPLTPCRVADTRSGTGAIPAGGTEFFTVQNVCGVPSGAGAYSLNVTAVPSGPLGWLTLWPSNQSEPVVSTLNSPNGTVVANAAIVGAGLGSVTVFVANQSNVVLDINGYFGQ